MSKIVLGACGDISFNGRLSEYVSKNGNSFPFEEVKASLGRADVLFGNMESIMVPEGFPSPGGLFCYDYIAESLQYAGFDIVNLANNHILDCGWKGLLHTHKLIGSMGIKTLGAGENAAQAQALQIIEADGTKIGFLGYQEPSNCTYEGGGGRVNYYYHDRAIEDVKRSRQLVDILVVSFHGDMEFNPSPSLLKVKLCRELAENGADLVLCHHPHVPQGVEFWGNSLIAYSLGNFAFQTDGYMRNGYPHTARSHILFIEIEDGRVSNWSREYFRIDDETGRSCKLSEKEYSEEEAYYNSLDEVLNEPHKLKSMWHEASLRYLKLYWSIMAEKGPEEFLRTYGYRIFNLMENRHWVNGVKEMIDENFEKDRYNDFEYTRPTV